MKSGMKSKAEMEGIEILDKVTREIGAVGAQRIWWLKQSSELRE